MCVDTSTTRIRKRLSQAGPGRDYRMKHGQVSFVFYETDISVSNEQTDLNSKNWTGVTYLSSPLSELSFQERCGGPANRRDTEWTALSLL